MPFSLPDRIDGIPIWENYVAGQASTAALGLISPRIAAIGVLTHGLEVTLYVQVDSPVLDAYPELDELVEEFNDLTGWKLDVRVDLRDVAQEVAERLVFWIYSRWQGEESLLVTGEK